MNNLKNLWETQVKKTLEKHDKFNSGYIYYITRDEIIFNEFKNIEDLKNKFNCESSEVLELHVFDEKQEFRLIKSNLDDNYIIHYIDEDNVNYEDVYVDEMVINNKYRKDKNLKLKVINYLSFDENGIIKIADYRLICTTYSTNGGFNNAK